MTADEIVESHIEDEDERWQFVCADGRWGWQSLLNARREAGPKAEAELDLGEYTDACLSTRSFPGLRP